MKKIFLILFLISTIYSCVEVENPDDNISISNKEIVEEPRMCYLTLYYLDGTKKEITAEYYRVDLDSEYVRISKENEVFVHVGQYDVTFDK